MVCFDKVGVDFWILSLHLTQRTVRTVKEPCFLTLELYFLFKGLRFVFIMATFFITFPYGT